MKKFGMQIHVSSHAVFIFILKNILKKKLRKNRTQYILTNNMVQLIKTI